MADGLHLQDAAACTRALEQKLTLRPVQQLWIGTLHGPVEKLTPEQQRCTGAIECKQHYSLKLINCSAGGTADRLTNATALRTQHARAKAACETRSSALPSGGWCLTPRAAAWSKCRLGRDERGSCASSGRAWWLRVRPLLESAASKVADSTAFDHVGVGQGRDCSGGQYAHLALTRVLVLTLTLTLTVAASPSPNPTFFPGPDPPTRYDTGCMVRVRASSSHGVSSSYFLPRMHFVPDGRVLALIDRLLRPEPAWPRPSLVDSMPYRARTPDYQTPE